MNDTAVTARRKAALATPTSLGANARKDIAGALNALLQNGSVDDLAHARRMNLAVNLDYDLAKLWPIVHPMLLTPGPI